MAFGPKAEPHQFINNLTELDPKHENRDYQGSYRGFFWAKVIGGRGVGRVEA